MQRMRTRLPRYLGLAVMSGSILALQIIFTRIFSIIIWHHFSYLVIGVALLGGGAAGTFLAVRQWSAAEIEARLGSFAALFSLAVLTNLVVISAVELDPLRMRALPWTMAGLLLYFATLCATFFAGGLAVASCFSVWVRDAHRLYCIDLLGAGVASLAVLWLLQWLGGPGALVLVALAAMLTAVFFGGAQLRRWGRLVPALVAAETALLIWTVAAEPFRLPIPESKELGWALHAQGVSRPEYTAWNPVARVDVLPEIRVREPMIVGGVSSTWLEASQALPQTYPLKLVTLDASSMTGIYWFDGDLSRFDFLRHAVIGAVYKLGITRPSVLNIGVGGGLDILLARRNDAAHITAIELNADVAQLLTTRYADYSGRLVYAPDTELIVAEGRSFLIRDRRQFDIIQGIGLDNHAALSGGAYVLAESYLYTVESFALALAKLTPRGVMSWTRVAGTPPREMLRLAGLAAEALRRRGVRQPAQHIAIVGNESESVATLLVARSPFARSAVARLNEWAVANRFPVLFDPFRRLETRYADYLLHPRPADYAASYPFNIYPVTDDSPFFYNYFRLGDWRFDRAADRMQRFPIGNLILLTLIALSATAAVVFILLPLWRYHRAGLDTPAVVPMLAYFALLGLGYIFVEIVLIQRFTLLVGYPTLAIATTVAALVTFSAVGSLLGRGIDWTGRRLRQLTGAIAALIAVYALLLPAAVAALLQWPDGARILAAAALTAPLALAMGLPFPSGLQRVGANAPGLVPWAWGINGVFSVVGASAVILLSMLTDFTTAMLVSAVFYALAGMVAGSLGRVCVRPPATCE